MSAKFINGDKIISESAYHNFGKYILDNLQNAKPHDVCLENYDSGEQLTFAQFIEYSVSLSVALSKIGVKKGDVVAIGCEKQISYLPITVAVLHTGAAFTPFDTEIGKAVLRHDLKLSQPNFFICSVSFWKTYGDLLKDCKFIKTFISFEDTEGIDLSLKKLIPNYVNIRSFDPADVEGETDIALILYSSGTTGLPKAVLISHLTCVLSLHNYFQDPSVKTVITCGEWRHRYDIFNCFGVLCAGRKLVFSENLSSDTTECFPKIVQDCEVNIAMLVPSVVSDLANAEYKYDLSSLQEIYCTGASLPSEYIEKVKARIPSLKNVISLYGMTEAGVITSGRWETTGPKQGSVGMACLGVTLKVVDPNTREILGPNQQGEICLRSPLVMKGYIGVESSAYLDQEGFLLSGDLGYYDEDTYFYIVGRLKDILCYDGFMVAPLQLELILLKHPAVREVCVVGKPAGVYGEEPAAFVVLQPGAKLTEQQLQQYVVPEVSPYMQLRGGVKFVAALPKNLMGKILRRELKKML